jgi:4-amino-4-deoxy-L-arabinose transferase-like glycosyltransferase
MKSFYIKYSSQLWLGVVVLLLIAFSWMLFYRLGVHPFIDYDESIYAQVAKEALVNHHWLSLTYFGQSWYEKPPLAVWLVALSYSIAGVNEWAARMPGAIATVITVVITLRWVWEIRKSRLGVIMTMGSYFIMFPFLTAPFFLQFDSFVALFIIMALYAWWKAVINNDDPRWLIVFGVSIGLGVMTKNVIGLLPLLPIGITVLLDRKWSLFQNKFLWYGVIVSLVLALPWHIQQSLVNGKAFWNNYFLYHVLQRFSTNLENNGHPFSYYFDLIFLRYNVSLMVFGGAFVAGTLMSLKQRSLRLPIISAASIFLILSISTTKLPTYVLMTLPLFVMIAGIVSAKIMESLHRPYMGYLVMVIVLLTFMYTGYQFNNYKTLQSEASEIDLAHKKIGLFLKDNYPNLPIYTTSINQNVATAYYSDKPVSPTLDQLIINADSEQILHTHLASVYLGKDFILIKE